MDDAVEEIMNVYRSLPARPDVEEVNVARGVINKVDEEARLKLEGLENQTSGKDDLSIILQEMRRNMISFQSSERKREAQELLDLEDLHSRIGVLIQRASQIVQSQHSESMHSSVSCTEISVSSTDDSEERLKKAEDRHLRNPETSSQIDADVQQADSCDADGGRLDLMSLAHCVELSARKGARELILKHKLSYQIDWLPDSIGKLSRLINLDLSENRLVTLPNAIGELFSLQTLNLHGNRIHELPESISTLRSLLHLDLGENNLITLPPTISKLVRLRKLDLSSNALIVLPETLGSLASLQILNVATNDIEEIPYTIGHCTSLKELHAGYNCLKALPEAIGRIQSLEILTVRYNNIRQLPTTTASMLSLRHLDLSFNQLAAIPESLCATPKLIKLDISNNFAELRALPRSIGNIETLEELICNSNQITGLPDSFGMLSNLAVLNLEGNPLEIPPMQVVEKGAQAVVKYMKDTAANKGKKGSLWRNRNLGLMGFASLPRRVKASIHKYKKYLPR